MAMKHALNLEYNINQRLLNLHANALNKADDPQVSKFLFPQALDCFFVGMHINKTNNIINRATQLHLDFFCREGLMFQILISKHTNY